MNRYTSTDERSYCLGMSLTIEALKHRPEYVEEVLLSEKAVRNKQLDSLLSLCDEHSIPVSYDERTIEKLSRKENCYCIGVFRKYESRLEGDDHVVLYGFNDFGELGTILRSAVSFDYRDIVLVNCSTDVFDPRCIRASMGSFFLCNIVRFDTLEEYLSAYGNRNLCPFVSGSVLTLDELELKSPYSLIISQDYYGLDGRFKEGYMIAHDGESEISLSVRSSIILASAYHRKRSL